jgi:hypothetical protein
VIISPDLYMLPINTSTVLLDSSCKLMNTHILIATKDDEQMTDVEIEKAHVIILVYDVNNVECIKRLRSYWIPRIIKINDKVIRFNYIFFYRSLSFLWEIKLT